MTRNASPNAPADSIELGLADLIDAGRRHRRLLIVVPAVIVVLTAVWTLLTPRQYSSTVSLVADRGASGGLEAGGLSIPAGLAARFGFTSGGTRSPEFYARLLESPEVLGGTLERRYPTSAGDSATIIQTMELEEQPAERGRQAAINVLRDDWTRRDLDDATGIITVRVTTPDPLMSQSLAAELVTRLNEFNIQTRQSSARAMREFIETQLRASEASLRAAEDRLRTFRERNRLTAQSPALRFDEERLGRQVQIESDVYLGLRRQYEEAKIHEVEDVPVLTVIDRPRVPARPDPRGTIMRVVLAGFIGIALALVWIATVEYVRSEARYATPS